MVRIVDHGLGMTAEQLDAENGRLVSRERLDLAPTDVLGLFVVGRLARRHGIEVLLAPTPGTGVTAEVRIPARAVVRSDQPVEVREPATAPSSAPVPAPPPAADGDGERGWWDTAGAPAVDWAGAPGREPRTPDTRAVPPSGTEPAAPAAPRAPPPAECRPRGRRRRAECRPRDRRRDGGRRPARQRESCLGCRARGRCRGCGRRGRERL